MSEYSSGSKRTSRFRWSDELHVLFLQALQKLGPTAFPSQILKEMYSMSEEVSLSSLTREQVASHLQKFRTDHPVDTPKFVFKDETSRVKDKIRKKKKRRKCDNSNNNVSNNIVAESSVEDSPSSQVVHSPPQETPSLSTSWTQPTHSLPSSSTTTQSQSQTQPPQTQQQPQTQQSHSYVPMIFPTMQQTRFLPQQTRPPLPPPAPPPVYHVVPPPQVPPQISQHQYHHRQDYHLRPQPVDLHSEMEPIESINSTGSYTPFINFHSQEFAFAFEGLVGRLITSEQGNDCCYDTQKDDDLSCLKQQMGTSSSPPTRTVASHNSNNNPNHYHNNTYWREQSK